MHLQRWGRVAIVLSVVLWLTASNAVTDAGSNGKPRPWKGSAVGQGEFFEFILDQDTIVGRLDQDRIVGQSTHLGCFTVTPELDENDDPVSFHTLSFIDGSFEGKARWRAANGDELFITYEGFSAPETGVPIEMDIDGDGVDELVLVFVIVEATFFADGGTGRFEDAIGVMEPTGKFFANMDDPTATIPYFFDFEGGTLSY